MSGFKKNINFITELLSSDGISEFQKFQILQLLKKEVENHEKSIEVEVIKKFETESLSKKSTKKLDLEYNEFHDPKAVQQFLIQFTLDNKPVKFLTHPIDIPFNSYAGLMEPVNEKEYYTFWSKIQHIDSDLWWKLIYPFIFQRHLNKNQSEGDFGWGQYSIKMGWQYPENLRTWCAKNFDNQSEGTKKLPGQMKIPKEFLPRDVDNKIVKPHDKSIKFFNDIIDLFNREIRFVDGELRELIEKLIKEYLPQHNTDLSGVSHGLPKFYVNTGKVKAALKFIFRMINERTESKNVIISCESNDGMLILKIVHLQSFPSKQSDLRNGSTKGSISSIVNKLRHVCNFAILTSYNDSDESERFDYLFDEMGEMHETKRSKLGDSVAGFTFMLEFLLSTDE